MDDGAPATLPADAAIDSQRPLPLPAVDEVAPARGRILRQYELVERVKAYSPDADEDAINRAYVFAMQHHGSQLRASGDPYFAHPIEVAGILTELKLDTATIVTALLHDTVEDTTATLDQISRTFSPEVAELVDGVTKLTKLEVMSVRTSQAENLQKFVLALARDVRVLLVKLADRLHNMRTLRFIKKKEKRARIARETLDIYAPLARRIGISRFATELEELSFKELEPNAYSAIQDQVALLSAERAELIAEVVTGIEAALEEAGIKARVLGRQKRPYSIFQKLERKTISFSQIADLFGFRVIVDTEDTCYRALGIIHRTWQFIPGRFKDFVSVPRPNGYQSIHTSVVGPGAKRVEIQIRTSAMDAIAENGVAAHWRYKNQTYGYHPLAGGGSGDPLGGLRSLVDILEHGGDAEEFLENARLEMFQDQVFVFTPTGDLIVLPNGATAVDFAYAVHTKVGDTMVGARINGENRPLRTVLRNGDSVEVLRSDIRRVPPDWESMTVTGRARSAIRRLIRETQRDDFLKLGKRLTGHGLRRLGLDPDQLNLEPARETLGFKSVDEMYVAVGKGRLTGTQIAEAVVPGIARRQVLGEARVQIDNQHAGAFIIGDRLDPALPIHFMPCCSPLPGDRIMGVHIPEKGIEVHTSFCEKLAAHEADDWIDLAWSKEATSNGLAVGRLVVTCQNTKGVFAEVGRIIADSDGNITNVRAERRSTDFIDLVADIEVASNRHLNTIAASLRALPVVVDVQRRQG
jgi:GTP diphosphokinase / guanosine-3',5'-bis(diphosphate) 3'-diphosphatase